ncbi:MAG: L-aspartate oxidase, partial [Nocardioidaceae bacterium]
MTVQGGGPRWEARADVVVVGSGAAGLTAALRARERGLRVLVVTKAAIDDGNTRWAQGGIAVVQEDDHDEGDGVDRHIEDTVAAGAGLCDLEAVAAIVSAGARSVARLRARGACFDLASSGRGLARTREGGHSAFRVIHAGGDATGSEVERALVTASVGRSTPVLERHVVVDLVRTQQGAVGGLLVLDADDTLGVVRSPAVVLATGGLGQLYRVTSNPSQATGDGLALALRAGAIAADLEFVQFHPTVMFAAGATGRCPLVTEALRGEGAVLVDGAGEPVMAGAHPAGDLAPRDVVSAAIARRLLDAPGGVHDHVLLDATGIGSLEQRFPTVYAACVAAGVDPVHDPIPVAPAAHFACGGVLTDTTGRTTVPGLYAAGEVARTGLHGANRLASNSLLEGLVMGEAAANAAADDANAAPRAALDEHALAATSAPVLERESLQQILTSHAGIGRNAEGLDAVDAAIERHAVERELRSTRTVED